MALFPCPYLHGEVELTEGKLTGGTVEWQRS